MEKYNNEDYNWWSSPANISAKEVVPFLLNHFTVNSVIDYGCEQVTGLPYLMILELNEFRVWMGFGCNQKL